MRGCHKMSLKLQTFRHFEANNNFHFPKKRIENFSINIWLFVYRYYYQQNMMPKWKWCSAFVWLFSRKQGLFVYCFLKRQYKAGHKCVNNTLYSDRSRIKRGTQCPFWTLLFSKRLKSTLCSNVHLCPTSVLTTTLKCRF